jgi:hypothetical protein
MHKVDASCNPPARGNLLQLAHAMFDKEWQLAVHTCFLLRL